MKESDENNPISTAEILAILSEEYNLVADRKAIYSGVQALIDYGYDIIATRTPKQGWFIASRDFELPEVRLLADAVASAEFITTKKSKELISKLSALTSKNDFENIRKQIFLDKRIKNENEEIFYNIDKLHTAISKKCRVNLKYVKRILRSSGRVDKTTKSFEALSPYSLVWVDDHYYLLCNNKKYDNIMHLRLDRIKSVEISDEPARPVSEVSRYINELDVADYVKRSFNMFGGDLETVILKCPGELTETVFDRFGKDIKVFDSDGETFSFSTVAMVSEGLISFVLQFEGVEVIRPESLREKVKTRIKELNRIYNL
jgi:predicted DNA-binding transcriptional regulator YafY